MTDFKALATAVYEHAEKHYGDKDIRWDVIVECMTLDEIAAELASDKIDNLADAIASYTGVARLQHEQELNQAEDGPESCIGSSRYQGEH